MKTPEIKLNEGCERKEDLIDYLYEEMSADGRVSFERHLAGCRSCNEEMHAFGRVRDDLSTWQVGFIPQTQFEPPRRKWDVLMELVGLFPVWSRGVALAALGLMLATFTFGASQMLSGSEKTPGPAITSAEIETIVQEAVAKERLKLKDDLRGEMADFKEQINADHEAQIQSIKVDQETRIKSLQAGFRAELRKVNGQNSSIRSFFAMDDTQDSWGGTR